LKGLRPAILADGPICHDRSDAGGSCMFGI